MKHLVAIFILIGHLGAFSQTIPPRDTSFTTYSAYTKAKKTHPFISIAQASSPQKVKTATGITYVKYGNRKLQLDVFSPKDQQQNLPVVLLIFGGGWRSGDRSMNNAMAQELAANGFLAVSADYRLSTEAIYPAAVNDLQAAIKWIRKKAGKYKIDKNKIAVMGCSAGGQLAALLGTTNKDIKAVVDVDGIMAFIHPESGEGDDSKNTSAATYWFGVPKTAKPELWQQASALNHIGSGNPPFLFLNSSVGRMHAGRDDAIKKLDAFHIYSEVHTFADAPHPFWLFNPWFEPTIKFTVTFLNKTLKD